MTHWAIWRSKHWSTPVDKLAEVEGEVLANTLGDVAIDALNDTLAERLAEVEAETVADILGDVENEALLDTLVDSGALAREARLRSTMGKQIYPSQKIW